VCDVAGRPATFCIHAPVDDVRVTGAPVAAAPVEVTARIRIAYISSEAPSEKAASDFEISRAITKVPVRPDELIDVPRDATSAAAALLVAEKPVKVEAAGNVALYVNEYCAVFPPTTDVKVIVSPTVSVAAASVSVHVATPLAPVVTGEYVVVAL
jgi:hypothetical protein